VDWIKKAQELKRTCSWTELPEKLLAETGLDYTREKIRWALRRSGYKEDVEFDIRGSLIKKLSQPRLLTDLCEDFECDKKHLSIVLSELMDEGYNIVDVNGYYRIEKEVVPETYEYEKSWNGERIIRFALAGDNQSGSKFTQWTHLHRFYDIVEREEIPTVFHTGDITEGEEMRMGHKYECYVQGADDHVEEVVKNYPERLGVKTEFITGNHDHSLIIRAGLDIGKMVAARRDDMIYLGKSQARIKLTPKCVLELRHPVDGTAYSLSYKPQKIVNAMSGGDKPNILAIGHYHKTEYLFYRNIHVLQTGCFQAQSDWMRNKGIDAHLGGWLVEVHVNDEGEVTRIKTEFLPVYKPIKNDYLNWR